MAKSFCVKATKQVKTSESEGFRCFQEERWKAELQREELRQQEDQLKVDTQAFIQFYFTPSTSEDSFYSVPQRQCCLGSSQ